MTLRKAGGESSVVLRGTAAIATPVAAIGSLGLLLHAGGPGISPVLVFVMATWTLAPFAALELTRRLSVRWSILSPTALFALIVVVTAGSLVIYGVDAVKPLNPKAAFPYVVVPLGSWLVIAATVLTGRLLSHRNGRRKTDVGR